MTQLSLTIEVSLNRLLKIIIAVAIVIAIPKVVTKVMLPDRKAGLSTQMAGVVAEANKGLPRKIDASTTLTKAEFDDNVYRIHYTMDPGATIDTSQQQTYKNFAVKQICGSNMQMMLDNKITIEYLYTFNPDGRGDQTMAISIPPGSCR